LNALEPKKRSEPVYLPKPAWAIVGGDSVVAAQVVVNVNMNALMQDGIKYKGRPQVIRGDFPRVVFLGTTQEGRVKRD
jgi:hypothetical protein